MNYDKSVIIKRIELLREKRKEEFKSGELKYHFCKSKEAFALEIEIDRRTYYNWVNNKSGFPSLDNLLSICDKLECNLNYLLGTDDLPYIKTVSDASHFTNIDPRIIEYAVNNPDYLDFLNFFMLPKNCIDLFHNVYLSEWKSYLIGDKLSVIQPSFLITIQKAFDKFYSMVSPNDINVDTFKGYLREFIPSEKVIFTNSKKYKNCICVSDCFSVAQYKDFLSKCPKQNKYDYFIDYVGELSYSSLINGIYLEIHKRRIGESFMKLLEDYLEDLKHDSLDS